MWNAICYSAEYRQKFSSLELCQQLPLRFSRFPGDISTPSHIKVNQGSQIKTIFKNKKKTYWPTSGPAYFFRLVFVYLSVCTVQGERLLPLIKGEPLSCPQMPKRHGPTGKMVIISHGNCGRVGNRLIIHSCVQEQLRRCTCWSPKMTILSLVTVYDSIT